MRKPWKEEQNEKAMKRGIEGESHGNKNSMRKPWKEEQNEKDMERGVE